MATRRVSMRALVLLLLVALLSVCASASASASVPAAVCGPLAAPQHGAVVIRNSTRVGESTLATFSCALGRQLEGEYTSACRRSGQWSHPAPRCTSVGLRAYPDRAGLAAVGTLPVHSPHLIWALSDVAQRKHAAVGFTMELQGAHRVMLLRQPPNATMDLIPSPGHDTFVFTRQGTLKRHAGMKSTPVADLELVEFATNPAVLKGLRAAVVERRGADPNVVGFSVATGTDFQVSLLGWNSLPLRKSKAHHAFVLRAEVDEAVVERGCFKAGPKGEPALRSVAPMPKGTTVRSARLVCAAIAREKGHRFAAISGSDCFTGNNAPDRYGAVAEGTCAVTFKRAALLKATLPAADAAHLVVGAGAPRGFFHSFELSQSLLPVPLLSNGGFELPDVLDGSPAAGQTASSSSSDSKRSVVLGVASAPVLADWTVDNSEGGEVGLATWGSGALRNHTVAEGKQSLYISGAGAVRQQLNGLRVGRRYTLKFAESFRKDQAPGMTLRVQLGDAHVIYQNPDVSVPLWSRRSVNFRATAPSMQLSFIGSDSRVAKLASTGVRPLATLLLDDISITRRTRFAAVKAGKAGKANHGRVATIDTKAPELIAAFTKIARRTAKRGEGGLGFRVADNIVSTLGVNDLRLKASPGALIVLNNGTIIKDFTTRSHSGHMSMRHPAVLDAISRIARRVANSVGFSVGQDMRRGVRVHVLAPAALPLEADAAYNTYLFHDDVTDLGCWALPPNGANILRTVHAIRTGPVTKQACAMAAAQADHSYFALQNGNQCVSGRNNPDDQSDDLYYANGRSSQCNLRCPGEKNDICGGAGAANVFRLPLHSRVSKHGHASTSPLRLSKQARKMSQLVFDQPGVATFSSANEEDLVKARKAATAAAGQPVNAAKVASWAHPLLYHFGGSQRYAVTRYVIQAPTLTQDHELTPSAWTFEGSHDGRNWTVLDRQSGVAFYTGQHRGFTLRHSEAFHFHRLLVTDNGGAGCAGFAVQGVELLARREKVRFLKALYRFDDPKQIGHDSSVKANDLQLFGGAVSGDDADLLSVFNVTTNADEVKYGKGSLQISNRLGARPSWLALDEQKRVPDGVPVRGRSFGVAFWFQVNSARDVDERFGGNSDHPNLPPGGFSVIAWGDSHSKGPSSNRVSLDRDFAAVRNSFHGARGGRHGLATPALKGNQSSLLDAWHHYAVSYDQVSGSHRVWLDGKLVAARLYQNPRFSVTPEQFVLGLSMTGGANGTRSDEFNGLLDDVAIFNGPLSGGAVREIVAGQFDGYMPLGCQGMSDEFGVEAGVTWGRASRLVKERYLRLKCFTKPTDCQQLSDRFDLSPISEGRAGYYASKQYRRQQCATWPSVIVKADTFAQCAGANQTTTVNGVATAERAISVCHQLGERCKSYVWGGETGDAASGAKAQQLVACAGYLSDLRQSVGVQIVTRVGSYLVHPNSKIRCDSQSLPTHRNVPSSLHARWLCDATPGCTAYVWSGLRGEHAESVRHVRKATPNRLILCAATRKYRVLPYAGSGYEVGEKLGAYLALADRQAPCSPVSALAIVNGTRSSLEAQRECDRMDGKSGVPRCASYLWSRELNQTRLCSSVPQRAVAAADDVELGLRKPESCQEMSDSFGVAYGETWGAAPFEIKQLFHAHRCTTKPRTCAELSDAYQLSPDVSAAQASLVPGTVRDLWLRAQCRTRPEVKESKYLISATFDDLQAQVDRLADRAAQLDARIAAPNPALTPAEQAALHAQLKAAKGVMQKQLDAIREQQAAELAGLVQQPAKSDATLSQTRIIHDIADGLFENYRS